ncbi:MAG TPA: DUF5011 domain-containing protein, partial [Ghiorsea sp.]|nr:DUF5011 domain-containing protein [Ghiorsea sp.]
MNQKNIIFRILPVILLCVGLVPSLVEAVTPQLELGGGRAHAVVLKSDGTVAAWGANLDNQGTVPVSLTGGVVSIAAGGDHNLAVKSDGTVFEWGFDVTAPPPPGFGLPLPIAKPNPLNGVVAVSGGAGHSLALKLDGTVVAWGDNGNGQSTVPVSLTGVVAIAAGDAHNLALKADGTVVGWGSDIFFEATGGAGFTGIQAIAAGGSHSLALTAAGNIVGWGDNTSGQYNFPAGLTGVTAIAAGNLFSLYLKSDGTVGVAGITTGGGNITAIPGILTNPATANVVSIAAGAGFALALQADGSVVVWGDDFSQQVSGIPPGLNLGATVTADTTAPVINNIPLADVIVEALGVTTPASLTPPTATDASAVAFSNDAPASFPFGTTVVRWTVTDVYSNASTATQNVIVKDTTAPVIRLDGLTDVYVQLGNSYTDVDAFVTDNVDADARITGVGIVNTATAGTYTITYNYTDAASNAAVGVVRHVHVLSPTDDIVAPVISLNTVAAFISQVAGGGYHSLALKSDGTVVAWGGNTDGQ